MVRNLEKTMKLANQIEDCGLAHEEMAGGSLKAEQAPSCLHRDMRMVKMIMMMMYRLL